MHRLKMHYLTCNIFKWLSTSSCRMRRSGQRERSFGICYTVSVLQIYFCLSRIFCSHFLTLQLFICVSFNTSFDHRQIILCSLFHCNLSGNVLLRVFDLPQWKQNANFENRRCNRMFKTNNFHLKRKNTINLFGFLSCWVENIWGKVGHFVGGFGHNIATSSIYIYIYIYIAHNFQSKIN